MIRRQTRPGFTLLEVLLAMGIGVMLLGALYVAVETQLKNSQAAREIVEQSTLARALLARMGNDVTAALQLSDPGRFRNQKNNSSGSSSSSSSMASGTGTGTTGTGTATSGTGTSGTGTTSTTGATNTTNSGATGSGTSTVGTTSVTNASGTVSTVLPLGLIGPLGDNTTLHLFMSRLPRDAIAARSDDQPKAPNNAWLGDTRRVTYWLVGDGTGPNSGLARQEVQPVTSDNALDQSYVPPNVDNPESYIIANEVRSLTFSYWDGANQAWADSWDCTLPGADGVTPVGPPIAVAIEIGLPTPGNPDAPPKIYRHVVYCITANGAMPLNTTNGTTTGGGTTSP